MSSDIKLSLQQRSFVDRQVADGHFQTPHDVVAEALRLLAAKEERLSVLDKMLAEGSADLDACADRDAAEVFDELEQHFAPPGVFFPAIVESSHIEVR